MEIAEVSIERVGSDSSYKGKITVRNHRWNGDKYPVFTDTDYNFSSTDDACEFEGPEGKLSTNHPMHRRLTSGVRQGKMHHSYINGDETHAFVDLDWDFQGSD